MTTSDINNHSVIFSERLDLLRNGEIDEITLSNGTVVRIALSYRSQYSYQPVTQPGGLITLPGCIKSASLRRLCLYIFPDAWLVKDIGGLICFCFGVIFVSYGACLLTYLSKLVNYHIVARIFTLLAIWTIALLAVGNQLLSMLTNPGAHMLKNCTEAYLLSFPPNSEIFICLKCMCVKPQRTHHCSVCNRCIQRMDHHCPWINNCVGQRNQKYFVLYAFYVFWLCVVSCVIITLIGTKCLNNNSNNTVIECNSFLNSSRLLVMTLMLAIETILFGVFTLVMMCNQLYAICTDQGKLDRSDRKLLCSERIENFKAVFGGSFSFRWLLPFPSTYAIFIKNEYK
ncbi:hypothetical protein GJ496_000690 [Pomphorhynchus laevis]|nr:hypothetical protein GJ496_000690 [Pomphorhynchus laevis]